MPPRAIPTPPPVIAHLPPRVLYPAGLYESSEPSIRRYAMQWLQHAAARVHKRCESTQRQSLFVATVLGIHQLFDVSDVPKPRTRSCPGLVKELGPGSSRSLR